MRMSQELGIDLVATNDIHYINAEDAEPHDILLCMQTGKKLSDENRMRYEGGQYYCKSEAEMRALFPYAPEAIENTHQHRGALPGGDRVRRDEAAEVRRSGRLYVVGISE